MNQMDVLLTLFKYYAQFVPKEVLTRMFAGADVSGYDEVRTEVLNAPDTLVIRDFDTFVFSSNEKYVAQEVKSTKEAVLYVEYGAFNYDPTEMNGVSEKLAVCVAFPYSKANSDNLAETLLMNRMHNLLCSILDQMEKDQTGLDFCGTRELIRFPAEIVPVDPELFYDRAGWMAIFDHTTTNLI